jgi:hypothetical protein
MKLLRDYTAMMEMPLDQAFEAAATFYITQGYEKGASNPPTQAIFVGYKEPSHAIFKFNPAKSRRKTVELNFASKSDSQTTVKCKYNMPFSTNDSDWSNVRAEVDALEKLRKISKPSESENLSRSIDEKR